VDDALWQQQQHHQHNPERVRRQVSNETTNDNNVMVMRGADAQPARLYDDSDYFSGNDHAASYDDYQFYATQLPHYNKVPPLLSSHIKSHNHRDNQKAVVDSRLRLCCSIHDEYLVFVFEQS